MGGTIPKRVLTIAGLVLAAVFLFALGCWEDPQSPGGAEGNLPLLPQFAAVGPGALESPVRVTATLAGELLVSDTRSNSILTVDPVTLMAVQGLEVNGKPLAIGWIDNRLLVGNATTRSIQEYDSRGRLRGSFGHIQKPTDLAVDQISNLIFVLDAGAGEVPVFDKNGRLITVIGSPGAGPSELLLPMGIAVDAIREEVYVTDYGDTDNGNASVKIFDYQGQHLGTISGKGNCGLLGCSGGFSKPQGIAVDGQGQIFIVDVLLAQVLVFDRTTLKVVRTLGGRNMGSVPLRMPLDIVIGADDDLFVTSNATGRVEVFRGGAVKP
jgi:DNA-binding beta-propeller fold protein YncE